jgi:hypothetical protein
MHCGEPASPGGPAVPICVTVTIQARGLTRWNGQLSMPTEDAALAGPVEDADHVRGRQLRALRHGGAYAAPSLRTTPSTRRCVQPAVSLGKIIVPGSSEQSARQDMITLASFPWLVIIRDMAAASTPHCLISLPHKGIPLKSR